MITPRFTDSLLRNTLPAPIEPGERPISFYACGITPYSAAHIGHARSFVVFDAMAQTLRRAGHDVIVVRNITDIDDKIIARARETGEHWHALAHRYAQSNREAMAKLGVVDYEEPSASEHVPQILALVQTLLDKGHAYINKATGDVLFEVSTFKGKALMPHNHEDLLAHGQHRVDYEGKRSPLDFVLWKKAKPGEPSWPSPWSYGRPGWHIECSAMIESRFGSSVDYHGGGTDLRFPHHQAEIAQSEAAFDRPLAHRWVHHGAVHDSQGRKMSKSLGNTVLLSDALEQADDLRPGEGGMVLRLALLSTLWTKPLDWRDDLLAQAASHLLTWERARDQAAPDPGAASSVFDALANNLNTPQAIANLHTLAKNAVAGQRKAAGGLAAGLEMMGLDIAEQPTPQLDMRIGELLARREALRNERRWEEADQIRDELKSLGYGVRDSALNNKP